MSTTLKRTNMALDEATRETLHDLSQEWGVSKEEVVLRALADKKKENEEFKDRQKRIKALESLHANGITTEQADAWKAEIKAEREAWKDPWNPLMRREIRMKAMLALRKTGLSHAATEAWRAELKAQREAWEDPDGEIIMKHQPQGQITLFPKPLDEKRVLDLMDRYAEKDS